MNKTIMAVIGALVLLTSYVVNAAEEALFREGEIQLDANYVAKFHSGVSDVKNGGGFGVNYFLRREIGIGAEAYTFNTAHAALDRLGAAAIFRLPFEKLRLAPELRLGVAYDVEASRERRGEKEKSAHNRGTDLFAGIGVEYRVSNRVGIGVEVRGVKETDRGSHIYALGLVRARVNF